jgi:hypothetical protein
MGDGNWKPLALVLGVLFIIGILFNLIFGAFGINTTIPNPDNSFSNSGIYLFCQNYFNSNILDIVDTGINLFGFNVSVPIINPFAIGGADLKDFMITQLILVTYIPLILLIPFMILFILALIWTGIKLVLP